MKNFIIIFLTLTFSPKADPPLAGNFLPTYQIFKLFTIGLLTIIIWCGGILQTFNSFAQQYNFKTYSVDDGLAQSQVYNMLQDRDGYMWFATSGGLSRFNGLSFQNITTLEGLINNRVSVIIEDKRGLIWAGTTEGVSIINPKSLFKKNTLAIINITTENGLIGNGVRAIIEDSKGLIWFGTTKGISILDPGKNEWKELKKLIEATPVHASLDKSVSIDGTNLPTAQAIDFEKLTTEDGLVNDTINDIFEDSKGNLWFSTNRGVSKLTIPNARNDKQNEYYTFENITVEDGLTHNIVNTVFEDNKRIFWIGTQEGLVKVSFRDDHSTIKSIENVDEVLGIGKASHSRIFSILQDNKDKLWFGYYRYDPNGQYGKSFEQFGKSQGLTGGAILSSLQDREGNIWFGTAGHGVSRYSGKT